ncbi:MAG: ADP-ribosylglycohydrolase family protein [Flavobacteriales bacterium]|nr:ADP-ribosylglycohydrolase family protein [Flavobacteriales bacterium]
MTPLPQLPDRIRGVIFGQAVGDALGLGTEFMSVDEVWEHYPEGLSTYHQIIQDAHRSRWRQGDWTDDTDQFLCILDSLLEHGDVRRLDIASRFLDWSRTGGMGIGRSTLKVLSLPGYTTEPEKAARYVWERGRRDLAPNGAVMRTSILGVWDYKDHQRVLENATTVCQLTHSDPRCIDSCRLISGLIACVLRGEQAKVHVPTDIVAELDPRLIEHIMALQGKKLEHHQLDEPDRIGYTLKAAGAGWWAHHHAPSFEVGLLSVVHAGGDADTNGAVAGSVLGARFGFSAIPTTWVDGLNRRDELLERADRLVALVTA